MNLIQIAKERCSNWNDSNGRCFGWSPEVLRGEAGTIQARDHCRLKDGERCDFFERCVLPGLPRQDRAKMGEFALENKGVKRVQNASPSPSIEKLSQSQMYKKRKKLRAQVKTRLKAGRAS